MSGACLAAFEAEAHYLRLVPKDLVVSGKKEFVKLSPHGANATLWRSLRRSGFNFATHTCHAKRSQGQ
jgi:hypothetical protein